jgi:hypothetical protein
MGTSLPPPTPHNIFHRASEQQWFVTHWTKASRRLQQHPLQLLESNIPTQRIHPRRSARSSARLTASSTDGTNGLPFTLSMMLMSIQMCFVFFCQYLDKQSLSYASVAGLITDLHMNASQYSWCSSIFYIGKSCVMTSICAESNMETWYRPARVRVSLHLPHE